MGFVAGLGAALGVYNNATNLLRLPERAYVPVNLAAAALLLGAARAAGYDWDTLGMGGSGARRGWRWGGGAAAAVALALAAGARSPRLQPLLADQRVAGLTPAGVAWQTLGRIPLGTVAWEEVAFRGVLQGTWTRQRSPAEALVGSSVLFGIWHVGPTLRALQDNGITARAAQTRGVAAAVVTTTAAGGALGWLRQRTGGILAPALAHLATNSLGVVAAYRAQRNRLAPLFKPPGGP